MVSVSSIADTMCLEIQRHNQESELNMSNQGPKDKWYHRNAAAAALGVPLDGQSWRKLKPKIQAASADVQREYERLVRKFRREGVPSKKNRPNQNRSESPTAGSAADTTPPEQTQVG